jgi:hypothetical protein
VADLSQLVNDPDFLKLPAERQRAVAAQIEPDFTKLPPEGQDRVMTGLAKDPHSFAETRYGLPPGTLKAIETVESGGKDNAVSPTGVRGRMQITRATAAANGLTPGLHEDSNAQIDTAGRIMQKNLAEAKGDLPKALALYGDHRDKGYAARVMKHLPTPGEAVAPPEGTVTTTPTSDTPPPPGRDLTKDPNFFVRLGASAARRSAPVISDFVGVMNKWGFAYSAEDAKGWMTALGVPGAEHINTEDKKGLIENSLAAMGPAYLASSYPFIGATTEAATGSRQLGDLAELAVGGVQAVRQVGGFIRAGKQILGDYRAAKAAQLTEKQVADVLAQAGKEREAAATAEMGQAVVSNERRQLGWRDLARRPSQLKTPEEEFLGVTHLSEESATPLEVGRMASAKGRQRYMLAGEDVGPKAMLSSTGAETQQMFMKARDAAKDLNYTRGSGPVMQIQLRTANLIDRIHGKTPTPMHDLLYELQGTAAPEAKAARPLIGRGLTRDEENVLSKLRYLGGEVNPETGELVEHAATPKDMGELQDLYGQVARVSLGEGQHPTLGSRTSDARNEFVNIKNQLGMLIRTELAPHEDAAKAWNNATGYVLEVRSPARAAAEAMRNAKTEGAAFQALVGNPTTLFHTLRQAGPQYADAIRAGNFRAMLEKTGGDMGKFTSEWDGLSNETKMMMAAPSTPRSAKALADMLAKGRPDVQATMDWTKEFRTNREDLQVGVDAVERAIAAMRANVHNLKPNSSAFGKIHLVRGVMMAFHPGSQAFAAYHLGSYALMTRPGLVGALFSVPPQSARFSQAAAALEAALRPLVAKRARAASPPASAPPARATQ